MCLDNAEALREISTMNLPAEEWIYIDTGEHSGKFNMDFDVGLVEKFKLTGSPVLRVYSWKPYCISLGRNQNDSDINVQLADRDGIDIARRPTGGKAVLHAEELTYSVVMNARGMSVHESHNLISQALVEGLRVICPDLELSETSADFRRLFHDPGTIPCFSTSAIYEVESRGKKIVGSAQHRFGHVLLQHGTILIGDFHKRIVDYLNVNDETRRRTLVDLDSHTTTLKEIAGRGFELDQVKEAVRNGFKEVFGASFVKGNRSSAINDWRSGPI